MSFYEFTLMFIQPKKKKKKQNEIKWEKNEIK